MRVIARYFGQISDQMGVRQETLEITEPSLRAAIEEIARRHSSNFGRALALDQLSSIAVLVNGEAPSRPVVLKDGDVISFLPPVVGGSNVLAIWPKPRKSSSLNGGSAGFQQR